MMKHLTISAKVESIIGKIRPILKNNDVEDAWIFGSFARGEETDESDLDIMVTFTRPKGLFAVIGMENQIRDLLGREVDVLTKGTVLRPTVRKMIETELIPIF